MKRILKSKDVPALLDTFSKHRPDADWLQFKDKPGRYRQVVAQLRADQHGLCAYCEIDLLESNDREMVADCRVEHFHPKSPHAPPPNWALDWSNLLAVCHGGSNSNVIEATRFTKPDFSCDVDKKGEDWTEHILNPLTDIPASPRIFSYGESGRIAPDSESCPDALRPKAQASIDFLRLNANRLLRMRGEVLAALSDQVGILLSEGRDPEQAATIVAKSLFTEEQLPPFFTCVRWYLGSAAEARLVDLAYVDAPEKWCIKTTYS